MTHKEWLDNEIGESLIPNDEVVLDFYYHAMHDFDMGLTDADDYAWLNTLFGYDIGADHAKEIIRWFYENQDTTVQDAIRHESKDTLQSICELELGIHLDFSKWLDYEPEYLRYYLKEKQNES